MWNEINESLVTFRKYTFLDPIVLANALGFAATSFVVEDQSVMLFTACIMGLFAHIVALWEHMHIAHKVNKTYKEKIDEVITINNEASEEDVALANHLLKQAKSLRTLEKIERPEDYHVYRGNMVILNSEDKAMDAKQFYINPN